MSAPRALIVGGSVGGLFAAHLLRQVGWDVLVFERTGDDLAGRGAGIGTQDPLHEIMQRIGLRDDETMAVATQACACVDREGTVLYDLKLRRVTSAWARFYRPLKDALADALYRPGWRLDGVEQTGRGVTAVFADGTRVTGDVLIAADGIRSTVRAQLLPELQPGYVGYVGWRALTPEPSVPPALRAEMFERYTFCLPDGELVVAYPVPALDGDTRPGHRAFNLVWYRPADADVLADLCTDASGRRHDGSIPPPLIRPELVAGMKAAARDRLAPHLADILERADQPIFHPIYELQSPQLVFGRVALLGDAAFVARPHGGAGVTKAALDAAALADSLAEAAGDVDAGLARYDRAQRKLGDWIVGRGRHLGGYVGARVRPPDVLVRDYNATNAELNEFLTRERQPRGRVRS